MKELINQYISNDLLIYLRNLITNNIITWYEDNKTVSITVKVIDENKTNILNTFSNETNINEIIKTISQLQNLGLIN